MKRKVVFCEDDPMIQKLVRTALKSSPHEIHVVGDGTSGLELIRREKPDVVFTDVSMPGLDGYQLASALRDDPATAHIPIVFMTASVQRSQVDQAMRHGGASVLAKPFTMADLRARVDEFTGS